MRSGFVENIKANCPQVYAPEQFVLNGAAPNTTYTVTRNFFVFDPGCVGGGPFPVFRSPVGTVTTNAAGNGTADVVARPEEIPGFLVGDHGVLWTVADASDTVRYQTSCTTVTLDGDATGGGGAAAAPTHTSLGSSSGERSPGVRSM